MESGGQETCFWASHTLQGRRRAATTRQTRSCKAPCSTRAPLPIKAVRKLWCAQVRPVAAKSGGRLCTAGHGSTAARVQARLYDLRRDMRICMVTRFRKVANQEKHLVAVGLDPAGVILRVDRSALLKPLFIVVQDPSRESLVVIIRGTTSIRDIFTSLSGTTKPHHVVNADGVVLGHSHFGMLAAARWIHGEARPCLEAFLEEHPTWGLRIVGHSLGGGTAALLCMMCATTHHRPQRTPCTVTPTHATPNPRVICQPS